MKTIENYIKKRFKHIRKYLNQFSDTKDKESLHKFRVEIKRINTLIHLTGIYNQEFNKKKERKKFKKLLKLSGKIRDADILLTLLTQLKISNPDTDKKLQKRKKDSNEFCMMQQQYKHVFKALKRKLLRYSDKINTHNTCKYIEIIQEEIIANYALKNIKTSLHNIRKEVKELKYISEIYPDVLNEKELIIFDNLQESIGNWHDNMLLIEYLKDKHASMKKAIRNLERTNKYYLLDIKEKIKDTWFT